MYPIIKREYYLLMAHKLAILNPIIFLWVSGVFFVIALNNQHVSYQHATAIIWVLCLLSNFLGAHALFDLDYQSGSLEQLLLTPYSAWQIILGKILSLYVFFSLPVIVASSLLSLWLHIDVFDYLWIILSLLLGSPCLASLLL